MAVRSQLYRDLLFFLKDFFVLKEPVYSYRQGAKMVEISQPKDIGTTRKGISRGRTI